MGDEESIDDELSSNSAKPISYYKEKKGNGYNHEYSSGASGLKKVLAKKRGYSKILGRGYGKKRHGYGKKIHGYGGGKYGKRKYGKRMHGYDAKMRKKMKKHEKVG